MQQINAHRVKDLHQLTKEEIIKAGKILARAFYDDPVIEYYFPEHDERKRLCPCLWNFLLRDCIQYGEVYAPSKKLEGIAAWLPPENIQMTTWRALKAGVIEVAWKFGWKRLKRMQNFIDYIDKIHKKHVICCPHWYLITIGVDPQFQGRGFGSMLLKSMLNHLTKEKMPIYLETQTEESKNIYTHLGFEVLHTGIIPGTEIQNWAMIWFPSE